MTSAARKAARGDQGHGPMTAASNCDGEWRDVEWRARGVAPVLVVAPTDQLRHAIGETLDEWIGTNDLDRSLLITEQELPSVVVLEVDAYWTGRQLETMIRLKRLLPHGSFIAIAPRRTNEGIRIACDHLSLNAYFYRHGTIPSLISLALEFRAAHLKKLIERAQPGRARR